MSTQRQSHEYSTPCAQRTHVYADQLLLKAQVYVACRDNGYDISIQNNILKLVANDEMRVRVYMEGSNSKVFITFHVHKLVGSQIIVIARSTETSTKLLLLCIQRN